MRKPAQHGLWSRRWVWMTVAVIAVFFVGVAVGAGALITRDVDPRCTPVTSSAAEVMPDGR